MERDLVIGVDMGGTHLRTALVDRDGKIIRRRKTETAIALGQRETSNRLIHECNALVDQANAEGNRVRAIGLGVAGKVDSAAGKVIFSPNLRALDGCALAPLLSEASGLPVVLDNDANVFGMGEAREGAGCGIDNWLGVILGTGIGGCLVLKGELWTGDGLGFVAETGHFIVDPAGPRCICGMKGCLEAHASGRALREGIEDAVAKGLIKEGALYDLWKSGTLGARAVYRAAKEGDAHAREVFDRMGRALGLAIGNLFTVLGIRTAIIGGAVAATWDQFIEPLRQSLAEHSCMFDASEMRILRSVLGDDAALIGAAHLAWEKGSGLLRGSHRAVTGGRRPESGL
jgi:glucokinase